MVENFSLIEREQISSCLYAVEPPEHSRNFHPVRFILYATQSLGTLGAPGFDPVHTLKIEFYCRSAILSGGHWASMIVVRFPQHEDTVLGFLSGAFRKLLPMPRLQLVSDSYRGQIRSNIYPIKSLFTCHSVSAAF